MRVLNWTVKVMYGADIAGLTIGRLSWRGRGYTWDTMWYESSRSRDKKKLGIRCVLRGVEKEGMKREDGGRGGTLADLDAHGVGGRATDSLAPARDFPLSPIQMRRFWLLGQLGVIHPTLLHLL